MRIFPEMWPRPTWPFSSFTRKVALGRFSRISPCIWMTSSFAIRRSGISCSARLEIGLLEQRLVLLAHHVALHLCPEVHRHDNDDQERRAAEVERNVVLEDEELGQQADRGDVDRSGERQPRQDPVDVARGLV